LFNGIPFIPEYSPPLAGVFSWPWNPLISCTVSVWLALCVDFVVPRKMVNEMA
jgi:SSS family solute:Na+ symporter